MRQLNILIILLPLTLFSCSGTDEIVDQEIVLLIQSLRGDWASEYTQMWDNNKIFAFYNSNEIDCNTQYDYQYDIVSEMTIDSLTVYNTYFCTEKRTTYLELSRDIDNNIIITEMDGSDIYMRYILFEVSESEITLTGIPISEDYFKPWNPYRYVLHLKRK